MKPSQIDRLKKFPLASALLVLVKWISSAPVPPTYNQPDTVATWEETWAEAARCFAKSA